MSRADYLIATLVAWLLSRPVSVWPTQPAGFLIERKLPMHYRNGREAKNGDKIVSLGFDGGKVVAVGVLYDAVPGNDFCNGNISPIQATPTGACLCDCLHVDDLAAILKEKGLDKRPTGK